MKYMLMLFEHDTDWDAVPADRREAALDAHREFVEFLESRGAAHDGAALRPSTTATTLRPDGDDVLVTDGPYLELKENLGGFYIIEASDLDDAIDVAKRCPMGTATEIRPIWDTTD